jgi:hypothetical protein
MQRYREGQDAKEKADDKADGKLRIRKLELFHAATFLASCFSTISTVATRIPKPCAISVDFQPHRANWRIAFKSTFFVMAFPLRNEPAGEMGFPLPAWVALVVEERNATHTIAGLGDLAGSMNPRSDG